MAATWSAIGILAAMCLGTLFYLGARIDGLGQSLGSRIDALGARLDARLDAQTARIDAQTARIDGLTVELHSHLQEPAG